MTLGNFATKLLREDQTSITRIRGQAEVRTIGPRAVRLLPVLHPAAALYTPANRSVLAGDLALIPALLAQGPPPQPGTVPQPDETAIAEARAALERSRPPSRPGAEPPAPAASRTPRNRSSGSSDAGVRERGTARDRGAEETEAARGRASRRHLRPGDVVLVSGDLGAGKTTFVRGACRALGVTGRVTSPTFTIARRYENGRVPISHLDLYRLAGRPPATRSCSRRSSARTAWRSSSGPRPTARRSPARRSSRACASSTTGRSAGIVTIERAAPAA